MKLLSFVGLLCAGLFSLAAPVTAQTLTACPKEIEDTARCYTGADQNGSHYWIAIPSWWNMNRNTGGWCMTPAR